MPLIPLILALAIVGLIVYLIETYIPMDPIFKTAIRIIVIIAVVLWLISALGVVGPEITFPRLR